MCIVMRTAAVSVDRTVFFPLTGCIDIHSNYGLIVFKGGVNGNRAVPTVVLVCAGAILAAERSVRISLFFVTWCPLSWLLPP